MFIWPFRTKSDSQYRRIDQGWDLQGSGPGEEDCLAIASGTTFFAHDPGTGGAHFGDPYLVLMLDKAIDGVLGIYYGHCHPTVPEHVHVEQGQVVSRTSSPGGGGAPDHWLEIGPWRNGPTGNGQWMHDQLINAPVGGDDMYGDEDRLRDQQTHAAIADVQSRIGNAVQPEENSILDVLQKLRADFDAYVAAHP